VILSSIAEQALKLTVEEKTELIDLLLASLGVKRAAVGHEEALRELVERRLHETRTDSSCLAESSAVTARVRNAAAARRR
jgi:hypothetical protein